MMYNNIR